MRRRETYELVDLLKTGLKANEIVKFKARAHVTWLNEGRIQYMLEHNGDVALTGMDRGNEGYGLTLGDTTELYFKQRGDVIAYQCEKDALPFNGRAQIRLPITILGTAAELHLDFFEGIVY